MTAISGSKHKRSGTFRWGSCVACKIRFLIDIDEMLCVKRAFDKFFHQQTLLIKS